MVVMYLGLFDRARVSLRGLLRPRFTTKAPVYSVNGFRSKDATREQRVSYELDISSSFSVSIVRDLGEATVGPLQTR